MKGQKFRLVRGLEEAYWESDSVFKKEYKNFPFFATDSQKIYLNGILFGQGKINKTVSEVTVDSEGGKNILKVTYLDGDNFTFDLGILLFYTSRLPKEEVVPQKIGNIAAGTTVEELEKKSISEILDDIIFPEIQPEIEDPKALIVFKDPGIYSSGNIYEVGYEAPQEFITSYWKGFAKVPSQPVKSRGGVAIEDEFTGIRWNEQSKLPKTIQEGENEYIYQVHYEQGDVVVTSKGVPSTIITPNPLPSGIVKSNSLKIYGSYPMMSNGETASTEYQEMTMPENMGVALTKLPLQKWEERNMIGVKYASEAINNTRIVFSFPESKKITKVEYFNVVGGAWIVMNPETYTITSDPDQKIIQGLRVNYKMFTTTGNLMGSIQVRFTLETA